MSNEITGELEEFELFAQQLAQMAQEGTMPKPETELKQELPPYKVSPQDVASYKFDASKLSKSLAIPVDKDQYK